MIWKTIRCCLLLVALAVGCEPPITSGFVVGKQHVLAHSKMEWESRVDLDGDSYTVLVRNHYPEEWKITFQGQNQAIRTVSVDREIYDDMEIGDAFHMDPIEVPVDTIGKSPQ